MLMAIDPGNMQSAYAFVSDDYTLHGFGKVENEKLRQIIYASSQDIDNMVIERVSCYGLAVGREVFDTCVWIGRYAEQYKGLTGREADGIERVKVKLHICNSSRAKDTNVRQALIDRFATHDFKNGKGTKKDPDTFYGVKADIWAAIGLATTWLDERANGDEQRNKD